MTGKSYSHNKFLTSRVQLYPNTSASFQIEPLLCGDIELNPGPSTQEEHSTLNKIKSNYNRSELFHIGSKCTKLPVSPTVWAKIKSLGIQGKQTTHRGFRGGRHAIRRDRSDRPVTHHQNAVLLLGLRVQIKTRLLTQLLHPTSQTRVIAYPTLKMKKKFDCFKSRGLHFIHLNMRSMLPKLSELKILAHKTRASVIAISETWLDETVTDSEIELEDFNVIRNDRNRNGGGVCLYIKNNIAFNVRSDLCNVQIESIWAEILLPKSKPIVVVPFL